MKANYVLILQGNKTNLKVVATIKKTLYKGFTKKFVMDCLIVGIGMVVRTLQDMEE
jgi:hypothetical protein